MGQSSGRRKAAWDLMTPHRFVPAGDVTLQPPATGAVCTSKAALQSNFSLFICVLDQTAQDRCRLPA